MSSALFAATVLPLLGLIAVAARVAFPDQLPVGWTAIRSAILAAVLVAAVALVMR